MKKGVGDEYRRNHAVVGAEFDRLVYEAAVEAQGEEEAKEGRQKEVSDEARLSLDDILLGARIIEVREVEDDAGNEWVTLVFDSGFEMSMSGEIEILSPPLN